MQFYDSYYEMVRQQKHFCGVEIAKPEWAECDILVDAFFTWFEKKSEMKWKEDSRESHEAAPPPAGKHPMQFRPAH